MRLFVRCGLILGLVFFLAASTGRALAAPGPSAEVQAFYDVLLGNMKNAEALGAKGRYAKLEPVIQSTFDVPFMSRLSVGSLWGQLKPEQKQEVAKAFGRYITATYATQFDGYSGEQLKVIGEQQIKHGTLVRSQIVKSDGEAISINYVLHDNDVRWQIRDIYLAGTISQLATRRSEFSSILRGEGGIEKLVGVLNQKADALLH
ncbi:MAG TPA: ABC transporter substrate-binding protein [Aliidongia sp.]|uniref:ABC transporter substrate-binding protein n=1 Tax=Aliidongia sp. TaxID=1914230 RepID=UPI002DDCFCC6|nr:ABC transporter substrate-binding protein [Aliidongia sp.]HEV2673502.1 ABC transporter substrate-binding protein [Aliidongia sp.]